MKKSIILLMVLSFASFGYSEIEKFTLDPIQSSATDCPIKLSILDEGLSAKTIFTHESGLINLNNFNFVAGKGIIKGLAYPFGAFSYYRNYKDDDGFYFQRMNCERFGPLKSCGSWVSIQSYEFISEDTVSFELKDFFYRIDSKNYPTDLGRLPINGKCIYTK